MGEPDTLDTVEVDRNQALRQMVQHLDELLARSQELMASCRPRLENGAQALGCSAGET